MRCIIITDCNGLGVLLLVLCLELRASFLLVFWWSAIGPGISKVWMPNSCCAGRNVKIQQLTVIPKERPWLSVCLAHSPGLFLPRTVFSIFHEQMCFFVWLSLSSKVVSKWLGVLRPVNQYGCFTPSQPVRLFYAQSTSTDIAGREQQGDDKWSVVGTEFCHIGLVLPLSIYILYHHSFYRFRPFLVFLKKNMVLILYSLSLS